jgi:hypothetical protein
MSAQITAVLDTPEEASVAIAALRREGVPRQAITIMSAEPIHGGPSERDQAKSRIGGFAIAGGFIGAATAVLLTVLTSRRVDLVTGGMPIVTPWAFGIIVFELTALWAILATLGRMIFEARLARRGALTDYDKAVADGRVVLAIDCGDDACAATTREILRDKVRLD